MNTIECIMMASCVPTEEGLVKDMTENRDDRLNAQIIRALCSAIRDLAGVKHFRAEENVK